jgi:hypothetical protein
METVYVAGRGHVFHKDKECVWLAKAHDNAVRLGRRTHPIRTVKITQTKLTACRVCTNSGECPTRTMTRLNVNELDRVCQQLADNIRWGN